MKIKFDKDPLVVEQKNYLTIIVNVCIVYDLMLGQEILRTISKFKNWLFGASNTVENRDKEKYV